MSFPAEIGVSFYGGIDEKRIEISCKVRDSSDGLAIASALRDLANELNFACQHGDITCNKEWFLFSREIPRK